MLNVTFEKKLINIKYFKQTQRFENYIIVWDLHAFF